VLNVLKKELSQDKAKYDILGISKFGLVEMTRERVHKTVQMLSYQACPYCRGKGRVKSALTMSIYALKELRRFLKGKSQKEANITLNPEVANEILQNKADLRLIEHKSRTKINLIANPSAHIEDIKIS
jgi:ribonuclease G